MKRPQRAPAQTELDLDARPADVLLVEAWIEAQRDILALDFDRGALPRAVAASAKGRENLVADEDRRPFLCESGHGETQQGRALGLERRRSLVAQIEIGEVGVELHLLVPQELVKVHPVVRLVEHSRGLFAEPHFEPQIARNLVVIERVREPPGGSRPLRGVDEDALRSRAALAPGFPLVRRRRLEVVEEVGLATHGVDVAGDDEAAGASEELEAQQRLETARLDRRAAHLELDRHARPDLERRSQGCRGAPDGERRRVVRERRRTKRDCRHAAVAHGERHARDGARRHDLAELQRRRRHLRTPGIHGVGASFRHNFRTVELRGELK